VFNPYGFLGFCRFGRLLSGMGLQGCFFIETENLFMGKQLSGIEFADSSQLSVERFISRCLGPEPPVMSPRFQMMIVQDASYGFRGYVSTMPSFSSFQASSSQAQTARERPSRSGTSHAILTRCRATSVGNSGLSPPAGFVFEPLNSLGIEATQPKSNDSSAHSNHATSL
jgi:hypothetical protein